jgi:hypothetical protein
MKLAKSIPLTAFTWFALASGSAQAATVELFDIYASIATSDDNTTTLGTIGTGNVTGVPTSSPTVTGDGLAVLATVGGTGGAQIDITMAQAFTDGDGFDIELLEIFHIPPDLTEEAVSVWVKTGPLPGDYINVGTLFFENYSDNTAAVIPDDLNDGVWDGSQHISGWIVESGDSQIDLDTIPELGLNPLIDGEIEITELRIIGLDSVLNNDNTQGNYQLDAVHARYRIDNSAFVPIPAAVWLFGSGLLGLVATGRRRKK